MSAESAHLSTFGAGTETEAEIRSASSFGHRCFAVAGPSTWNSLPGSLRDQKLGENILDVNIEDLLFIRNIDTKTYQAH